MWCVVLVVGPEWINARPAGHTRDRRVLSETGLAVKTTGDVDIVIISSSRCLSGTPQDDPRDVLSIPSVVGEVVTEGVNAEVNLGVSEHIDGSCER